MYPPGVASGIACIVGAVILLLIERTTPKNELVLVKPWWSYSHWSVQLSIILILGVGVLSLALGLVL